MKNKLALTILVLFITLFSREKTIIREYRYQASENDSKITAQDNALSNLKKLAIQEVASYVESEFNLYSFEEKNSSNETTNQKIRSSAAGNVKSKILDESWDGNYYWVKAEVKYDEKEIREQLEKLVKAKKNQVPVWYIYPQRIKGKTVSVGSSKNQEAALISAVHNYAYQKEQEKSKIDDNAKYFSAEGVDENAEDFTQITKSLFKYDLSSSINMKGVYYSIQNFEDMKNKKEYYTMITFSKNNKQRIVKLSELGGINGSSRTTQTFNIEKMDLSFDKLIDDLKFNGYDIKAENCDVNGDSYWYYQIIK
ncbi:MAG: hypothetical protein JXQ65_12995 [Candidatus Marinimicrobia bacterium]|nr:hypothetical protein [Candidatus Neomarinimicrobiota bacterium]